MTARSITFELPWPPASLSGHANGMWWSKSPIVKKHRRWAHYAILEQRIELPPSGDIPIHIRFVPPNRRGDRTNYPNRTKPAIDGIAQGLGVNDRRFVPTYEFAEPEKRARLEITIGARI